MKILFVTGIFPPDHGGPASYVPTIARALAARHTITSVITLSDDVRANDNYPFPVIRILRKANKLRRVLSTIYTIRKNAKRADIVYVNGLIFESIIACKLLLNQPVVTKIVGDLIWEKARISGLHSVSLDDFQHESHGLKWNLLKWVYKRFINRCDAIIVPSKYLRKIVISWGIDPSKIKVVYNSTDPKTNVADNYSRDIICDCVTAARLVPWKGIAELIDVVCENNWTLNIIGDGPLKEELMERVRSCGCRTVRFLGYIPRDQVASELAKARIFVLNSTYEGLPHIVLEAKQAGVAVVATAVGGTSETIMDGVDGYLVPAGDKLALAGKIRHILLDDDERERVAARGKEQVLKNFSFETMLVQTELVLNGVARI